MIIDNNGKIGIGTHQPKSVLDIRYTHPSQTWMKSEPYLIYIYILKILEEIKDIILLLIYIIVKVI